MAAHVSVVQGSQKLSCEPPKQMIKYRMTVLVLKMQVRDNGIG